MTARRAALLALLADGAVHAGDRLGAQLGCTRAAVWKQVAALRAMGLPVAAVRGVGYQLPGGAELLAAARIAALLPDRVRAALGLLRVDFAIESTSLALLAAPAPAPGEVSVCVAEYQHGGRGRRGRRWLSPATRGLCFSLGWRLERGGRDLPALSLVAGLAVLRALAATGAAGLGVKWPNDVLAAGGKLAGILVDVVGEAAGPLHVVIGVGINVQGLPEGAAVSSAGGLPPVSLAALLPALPSRNALAACLVTELHAALLVFEAEGFAPFRAAWQAADALASRPVVVSGAGPELRGIAQGIDADGALLVDVDGARRRLLAGDVSLRPAEVP
jgi:BirA family biotin operon repressor/biotin-[acetyl-CoA-carboxylase] ligase